METKKLAKLLNIVGGVTSSRWGTVMDIVECINGDEPVQIVRKEWADEYKLNKFDLTNIKTWSTFDGSCVNLKFSYKSKKLTCVAKIYNGERVNGFRENLRFTAELILPNSFLPKIEGWIESAFDGFLEASYESHLEAQKKMWINHMKAGILNSIEEKQ